MALRQSIRSLQSITRSKPSAFQLKFIRTYRGDSGEMKHRSQVTANPTEDQHLKREAMLSNIAEPKFKSIQARHVRMPKLEEIPKASLPLDMKEGDYTLQELELEVRKKRLVYRAKQRGWLEVDVLLGTWAIENVHLLSLDELNQFEDFVNIETIDIYNIITLRTDVPESMRKEDGNGVVERIQEWARSSPLGKAEPDKFHTLKKQNNLN